MVISRGTIFDTTRTRHKDKQVLIVFSDPTICQPVYFTGRVWVGIWIRGSTRHPIYVFYFLDIFYIIKY